MKKNLSYIFGDGYSLKSNKGFTLAEVLITLGIIGVVSAMTIPTLMTNYQDKAYTTQLHKVYNELQQAMLQVMTEKNAVNLKEAGINSSTAAQNLIKKSFKVVTSCETSLTPCLGTSYRYSGSDTGSTALTGYSGAVYVLASGSAISPVYDNSGSAQKVLNVLVDVNGPKAPNIIGKDAYFMAVYNDGSIDTYNESASSIPLSQSERSSAGKDWKPFGEILNNNWK